MKQFIALILITILFSCNNDNKLRGYKKYHDKKDTYYKQVNNVLTKWIKLFPNTDKISDIYFVNKNGEYDSIYFHYFLDGKIDYKAKFRNNGKTIFYNYFFKDGTLKREFVIKNGHIQGDVKNYYKNGKIKSIFEKILLDDSIEINNNIRRYKENGELNIDSTLFTELITKKDTFSINENIEVNINVIIPKEYLWHAYFGFINKKNLGQIDYSNVKFITNKSFYFNPYKIGINKIGLVIEINLTPNKNPASVIKRFVKKQIYVTK